MAWVASLFWGFLVEKLASSGRMTILQIRNMSMAICKCDYDYYDYVHVYVPSLSLPLHQHVYYTNPAVS